MVPAEFAYIIDTFFALFAMTLIIFMVPGFAMLEAGLVRTKNVTTVLRPFGFLRHHPESLQVVGAHWRDPIPEETSQNWQEDRLVCAAAISRCLG